MAVVRFHFVGDEDLRQVVIRQGLFELRQQVHCLPFDCLSAIRDWFGWCHALVGLGSPAGVLSMSLPGVLVCRLRFGLAAGQVPALPLQALVAQPTIPLPARARAHGLLAARGLQLHRCSAGRWVSHPSPHCLPEFLYSLRVQASTVLWKAATPWVEALASSHIGGILCRIHRIRLDVGHRANRQGVLVGAQPVEQLA